jgi:hypothetical protein
MTGMRHSILPITDLRKLSQVFATYRNGKKEREGDDKKEDESRDGEGDREDREVEMEDGIGEREGAEEEDGNGEKGDGARKLNDSGNEKNKVHAFLVGQTCHWISLVSYLLAFLFSFVCSYRVSSPF